VLIFAAADALTKHLMTRYPVLLVLFFRYLVNFLLLLAILWPRHGTALFRTVRTTAVTLRGMSLVVASILMGLALQRMPVGETVAIIYIYPFVMIGAAVLVMGEKLSLPAVLASAAGFAGVLLIIRPGAGLDPLGVVFALLNVGPTVAYHLMSRTLQRTESMPALLIWTALCGFVSYGLALPWTWPGFDPPALDVLGLAVFGGLATVGHFLLTYAYRFAAASVLAPVNYLHLFWAGLLGWAVFGHVPDGWTLAGMALVGLSGVALAVWTGWTGRTR
jgi:drug/metabolite transporter (DMT)-like permease